MQNTAHYRVGYKVSYRSWVDSLKKRVEMYQMARVDKITNQADKEKTWKVLKHLLFVLKCSAIILLVKLNFPPP